MGSPDTIELSKKAIEELFRPYNDLLLKVAGPIAEEVGGTIRLLGVYYRTKLGIRFLAAVKRMIEEAGFEPKAVSPKLFLPILENATLEENEDLQNRWVALLANAANPNTPDAVHPSYIEVLKQLTDVEAVFLDKKFERAQNEEIEFLTTLLRKGGKFGLSIEGQRLDIGSPSELFAPVSELGPEEKLPTSEIKRLHHISRAREFVRGNLMRLGILEEYRDRIYISAFGREFLLACRSPSKVQE
jgi:hypothetical protein